MADYRKRIDPPAQYKNMFGDRSKKPMSVQMAEVGVEFTPVGTIYGINDIKEELQKENPDYYKIGMMAGIEAIGLIPGLSDAAIAAIKAGAKKAGLDKVADQTDALLSSPKAEDSIKTEIIAGPGAKSYSDASLLRAGRLEASGASPAQIEAETGRVKTGTPDDYLDNKPKTLADISPEYANLIGVRDHLEGYIKNLEAEDSSTWATDYPHIKNPAGYINSFKRQLAEINEKITKFERANPADEAGIVVKPQNPFKFEIDDSRIEIKNSDGNQTLKEATKHYPMIVRNIIPTHTELFEEYPNLEYLEFYVDPSLGTGAHFDATVGRQGAIVVGSDHPSLGSPNSKKFRNTFFHELQHAVQYQDYRIAGLEQLSGNPVGYGKISVQPDRFIKGREQLKLLENNPNLIKLRDEILEIFENQKSTGALDATSAGFTFPGVSPNPAKVFGDVKVAKKIARKMRELESELFKTYMRTASETEARLAGRRAQDIATVGSGPKPKVTSDLAKERRIETLKEYSSDTPKSDVDKKKEDIKIKLGSMTNEEVLRYATGAVNFARYATGIDKKLVGFNAFGPTKTNYAKGGLAESKGLSWGELIVDNILGLDNEYESFGEKLGKAINEDEIKFLKDAAIGVYEGAKEFVQAPVETTKQVVGEIKDSVTRLGSEDLNTRLQRMYGVSYEQATDEQVNQAREAVLGDALTALELVPAAKGATTVAKAGIAAVPGGLKADVIGQTKAMLSGDREFLSGTPTPKADAQPAGAQVPGMFDRKTPEEMQDYQKSTFEPPEENNPAKLMQELQEDTNMSTYDFGIGSDGFLDTAFTPVKIRYGSQVNMRVPIERYLRETGLYGRISEAAKEVPAKSYLPPSIILDDFNEMVVNDILTWYNEMLPHMLADASPEKIFRLAAHLNMYPDRDWRREENRSLIEDLAEEIYDEIDTGNLSELKITNPKTALPDSVKNSEKLKFERLSNEGTGSLIVRPVKPDSDDKYEFYDILGDGADEFKASLKPYLAEGIIDFLENNFERYIPETLTNPSTGTSTTRENLLRGVRQEWEGGPNFDLEPLDNLGEIKFKSLGIELLEDFKSRVGNREFVTGAEVLKALENDPRMNLKTIPKWMKTTEYKNKKIPVADLGDTIYQYSATSPQVSLKNKNKYTGYQRQFGQGFVGGEFKDYVEIVPSTSEKQQLFSDVYSHYGPRALSHTRATVLNKGDATWKPRESEILGNEDYMLVEELQSDLVQQGSQNKKDIEYSPIKKSQEALELNIQSLIAEASKRGVTKIVIPPFSKIAAARLMGERLDLALQNKSRSRKTGEIVDGNLLHRIYVTELNKALDKFEKNYPITIHRNVELPYRSPGSSTSAVVDDDINEPDFFNLPDDDEIFDAGPDDAQQALVDAELNDPNVTEADIITEDELLNDIAEMMDEDGNITDQILKEYEEPKPEFIGGGYILDISQMDKEFKLQEPKFAEGGTVDMNRQMQMAFMNEGGLRDDGMNQDPVSGNEVPSGSMAKEVRDDIPAQLSEGEYVVPADVVRYYGVKFFEDLRKQAKMGLQEMEADGRIGGEPVPAGGPKAEQNPLTPEEMEMLKSLGMSAGGSVRGFDQGGSVPSWVIPPSGDGPLPMVMQVLINPITGEKFTANTGGYSINYDALLEEQSPDESSPEVVDDNYFLSAPLQNPYQGRGPLGSSLFRTQAQIDADKGITTTDPGDTGGEDSVTSPEEFCKTMGMQYDPVSKMCVPLETTQQTGGGDDSGPSPTGPTADPTAWMKKFDYEDFSKLGTQTSDLLQGSAIPFGGVIGATMKGANAAQAAANIIIMKSQGQDTADLEKQLKTYINTSGLGMVPKPFINGDRLARQIAETQGYTLPQNATDLNGDPIFKDAEDYNRFAQKVDLTRRTVIPEKTLQNRELKTLTKEQNQARTSLAERRSEKKKKEARKALINFDKGAKKVLSNIKNDSTRTSAAKKEAEKVKKKLESSTKTGTFGFNKGGLMTKGKKKK